MGSLNTGHRLATIVAAVLCLVEPAIAGGHGHAAGGDVSVKGYVKSDGTYVAPHMRSAADGDFSNNWTTQGNVNPYTGKEGTRVTPPATYGTPSYTPAQGLNSGLPPVGSSYQTQPESLSPLTIPPPNQVGQTPSLIAPTPTPPPPPVSTSPAQRLDASRARVQTYLEQARSQNVARAEYWKTKGYNFDPSYMTAYTMDQKVHDIDRAGYWKQRGYEFNPQYMTAYTMDQKVKDIDRAAFWKTQGYQFDPNYMTAYTMDQKVKDIDRANFWNERGYSFDPTYMTAYMMDQKVNDIERAKYWEKQGLNFDPRYMTAYLMDREAQRRLADRH
jgi:hypothetical protein